VSPDAHSGASPGTDTAIWHARFAEAVRFVIAPVILFSSGFFTTDFLLSGMYTWPRTSRVVALIITVFVLSYEFVYKEQRARFPERSHDDRMKRLLYSCAIPYGLGVLALLGLVRLAS
jgi:hypothetical protein